MALRAGLHTWGAPRLGPPAGLVLRPGPGPAAPSGTDGRSPRALRCQPAPGGTPGGSRRAALGRTATRRLSPCARLRAFISSAPALSGVPASALPSTAWRAQAPLAAQRSPRARRLPRPGGCR